MGTCLSIDDPKNSGSTDYTSTDPNGNRNGNANNKPLPRPKKKNTIDNSTIDDLPIPHGNSYRDPPSPILLPDDPNFTCSANGRNGWLVDEVYDFGASVRFDNLILHM